MTCQCGAKLVVPARQGRRPSFCSNACRQKAYRARRKLPASLTARNRWVRRDGKRPVTIKGGPASSTNPTTWSTFAEVITSTAGDGFGVMMGDGLACFDLDHCLSGDTLADWAQVAFDAITEPILFVERSMSGDGLHVFVESHALHGFRRGGVEFYPVGRFIAITGDTFRP